MSVFAFENLGKSRRRTYYRNGTTLLELIVGIFIFGIIMTVTVGLFGRMAEAKSQFDRIRETHEMAQIAIDLVSKSFRSGILVSPTAQGDSKNLIIYDTSQYACIRYVFSSGVLRQEIRWVDEADCTDSYGAPDIQRNIVQDVTEARFEVVPTDQPNNVRGYVTIIMEVRSYRDTSDASAFIPIQTAVSFRNI